MKYKIFIQSMALSLLPLATTIQATSTLKLIDECIKVVTWNNILDQARLEQGLDIFGSSQNPMSEVIENKILSYLSSKDLHNISAISRLFCCKIEGTNCQHLFLHYGDKNPEQITKENFEKLRKANGNFVLQLLKGHPTLSSNLLLGNIKRSRRWMKLLLKFYPKEILAYINTSYNFNMLHIPLINSSECFLEFYKMYARHEETQRSELVGCSNFIAKLVRIYCNDASIIMQCIEIKPITAVYKAFFELFESYHTLKKIKPGYVVNFFAGIYDNPKAIECVVRLLNLYKLHNMSRVLIEANKKYHLGEIFYCLFWNKKTKKSKELFNEFRELELLYNQVEKNYENSFDILSILDQPGQYMSLTLLSSLALGNWVYKR